MIEHEYVHCTYVIDPDFGFGPVKFRSSESKQTELSGRRRNLTVSFFGKCNWKNAEPSIDQPPEQGRQRERRPGPDVPSDRGEWTLSLFWLHSFGRPAALVRRIAVISIQFFQSDEPSPRAVAVIGLLERMPRPTEEGEWPSSFDSDVSEWNAVGSVC